jgi:hypothetical protein
MPLIGWLHAPSFKVPSITPAAKSSPDYHKGQKSMVDLRPWWTFATSPRPWCGTPGHGAQDALVKDNFDKVCIHLSILPEGWRGGVCVHGGLKPQLQLLKRSQWHALATLQVPEP